MPTIGSRKNQLLTQVKNNHSVTVEQLKKLVDLYDDLQPEDFKDVIDSVLMQQLVDACRDPQEKSLWDSIIASPRTTPADIQNLQKLVGSYILNYPEGYKYEEAKALQEKLSTSLNEAIAEQKRLEEEERRRKIAEEMAEKEREDWSRLRTDSYDALRAYKTKYPISSHADELDDLMWNFTANNMSKNTLNRYLADWPTGRHASEARNALSEADDWERVRNSNDINQINRFRYEHSGSQFREEAEKAYNRLRNEKIDEIRKNPAGFSKDEAKSLMDAGILSTDDLLSIGAVSKESIEAMKLDRNTFPDIQQLMAKVPEIKAQKDCTDIFFFGTPGTGKTCLLMGLAHADGTMDDQGQSYTLNMRINGGKYASALQQYVKAGITPGRTFGNYISTIHANVSERTGKGKYIDHPINFVEMSGEEFAIRISDGDAAAFEDMGTGATELLRNDNRKVFFIIVDSGDDKVPFRYEKPVKDINGNVVGQDIVDTFISQLDILNKFMGLIDQDENRSIMDKVDAIHFIVTKADRLGPHEVRKERARDLLLSKYSGPVERLKLYCRNSKRINASSNYNPQVFTFSLGNFYIGDVFTFDNRETLQIVDAIRAMTSGKKERSFLDRVRDLIG